MSILSVINTPLKWILVFFGIGAGTTGGIIVGRKMNQPKLEKTIVPAEMQNMKMLIGKNNPKELGDVELKDNTGDWVIITGKNLCPSPVGTEQIQKIPGENLSIRSWGKGVKCFSY